MMENTKHDKNDNLVYWSDDGHEHWYTYNKNSQVLHYKTTLIIPVKNKMTMDLDERASKNFWESWKTYDRTGRIKTYKDSNGVHHTYKYDKESGEVERRTNSMGAFEPANEQVDMHKSTDLGWSPD